MLYSRDFYDVVKKHLQRDGILQTWYPENEGDSATTASIAKALIQSFPYVRAFRSFDNGSGIHFLASMEPLPAISSSAMAAHMPPAAASDFVEWGPEDNAQKQFELVLPHEVPMEKLISEDPRVPALQDDKPINEYYFLRRWLHYYR